MQLQTQWRSRSRLIQCSSRPEFFRKQWSICASDTLADTQFLWPSSIHASSCYWCIALYPTGWESGDYKSEFSGEEGGRGAQGNETSALLSSYGPLHVIFAWPVGLHPSVFVCALKNRSFSYCALGLKERQCKREAFRGRDRVLEACAWQANGR